jgi:hypothetical protein
MNPSFTALSLGLCLASAAIALPAGPPLNTQPGTSSLEVLCTVTDKGLSSRCRVPLPVIADPVVRQRFEAELAQRRPRMDAELAYVDAHPFPISGAETGDEVKVLVRLNVTPGPGGKGFAVAESEDLFRAASGPPIDDPVWARSPNGAWAAPFTPERAQRLRVSGAVAARCVATASGGLVNCWILKEEPPGQNFAGSFLKILECARLQPLTASGTPVAGRPIAVAMRYDLAK